MCSRMSLVKKKQACSYSPRTICQKLTSSGGLVRCTVWYVCCRSLVCQIFFFLVQVGISAVKTGPLVFANN